MMRRFLAAALLFAPAVAAEAQAQAPVSCPLPAGFAGWAKPAPVTADAGQGEAAIVPGRAARVALHPAAHLRFAVAPAKPGAADTHGGTLAFDVVAAGTWRVAVSAPAWIDVIEGGRAVASAAHGHGPDCSGIRKIVDFSLRPGRHLLQIAGSPAPAITAMVVAPR